MTLLVAAFSMATAPQGQTGSPQEPLNSPQEQTAAPQEQATAPQEEAAPPLTELAGRVVRGTGQESQPRAEGSDEAGERDGVPGATVELHRVTADDGGAVVDSAVTGPDGSFRFRLSDAEGRPIFLVAARHQGIRYFGPALHAGLPFEGPYEVAVYDTAAVDTPPADLRVGVRHVVVTRGPDGGLDVAEVIDVIGPDDRTLVPASDTLALWSTPLPEGATDPQVLEGSVPSGSVEFFDGRVRLRSMIAPAGARLSYTYGLEGDELELPVEHPIDRLEVVVAGAEAEVDGAFHAETTTRSGRLVHRYEGTSLEPGETIGVRLVDRGDPGVDRWALIWAAIGAALLLAAGALWYTGRRTAAGS